MYDATSQDLTPEHMQFARWCCPWSHATETRCVRDQCRIAGFPLVFPKESSTWLSTHMLTVLTPQICSTIDKRGSVNKRIAASTATISDSGVEREPRPYRLDKNDNGAENPAPGKNTMAPTVDLCVAEHPAEPTSE